VALPLLDYPTRRLETKGKLVVPKHRETTAPMMVGLSPIADGVKARFEHTLDRDLGSTFSAMALFLVLVLF